MLNRQLTLMPGVCVVGRSMRMGLVWDVIYQRILALDSRVIRYSNSNSYTFGINGIIALVNQNVQFITLGKPLKLVTKKTFIATNFPIQH